MVSGTCGLPALLTWTLKQILPGRQFHSDSRSACQSTTKALTLPPFEGHIAQRPHYWPMAIESKLLRLIKSLKLSQCNLLNSSKQHPFGPRQCCAHKHLDDRDPQVFHCNPREVWPRGRPRIDSPHLHLSASDKCTSTGQNLGDLQGTIWPCNVDDRNLTKDALHDLWRRLSLKFSKPRVLKVQESTTVTAVKKTQHAGANVSHVSPCPGGKSQPSPSPETWWERVSSLYLPYSVLGALFGNRSENLGRSGYSKTKPFPTIHREIAGTLGMVP